MRRHDELVSPTNPASELGAQAETARSHLREYFEEQAGHPAPEQLTQSQADALVAWHATGFSTAG